MSGHSHWAKVKRSKAVTDARRGKEWSKLARRIIVAAKGGGPNPDENLSLRYAIDDARAVNMPNDTIDKAIKKGSGELGAVNYEPITYEGYGAGGVAFMVECLTDNRHRTAPEMRKIFERAGGQMGSANCVAWMFEQKGLFLISSSAATEDALLELALEAGADDVKAEKDYFQITCPPAAFAAVKQALAAKKIATESAAITRLPKNTIPVGPDKAGQVLALLEALEEHDDVQHVYANFDIAEEAVPK
ncbi:MAG: YebC/PmpR family DNA-binding transcriptional regulator [Planctomycetes bacterium]|nr:YebC/PmpR family DNA-binding transcriptional regulator [Planctomycetota bacterium]